MIDDGDQPRPEDRDMLCVPMPGPSTPSGARLAIEPPTRHRHHGVRVLGGLAAVAAIVGGVALLHTPPAALPTGDVHSSVITPHLAAGTLAPRQTTLHTEYESGTLLGIITWRSARLTVTAGGSTATAWAVAFSSTTPPDSASAGPDTAATPACVVLVGSDTHTGTGPNDPTLTMTATQTSDGADVRVQRPGGTPNTITDHLITCDDPPITGAPSTPAPPVHGGGRGLRPVLNS